MLRTTTASTKTLCFQIVTFQSKLCVLLSFGCYLDSHTASALRVPGASLACSFASVQIDLLVLKTKYVIFYNQFELDFLFSALRDDGLYWFLEIGRFYGLKAPTYSRCTVAFRLVASMSLVNAISYLSMVNGNLILRGVVICGV